MPSSSMKNAAGNQYGQTRLTSIRVSPFLLSLPLRCNRCLYVRGQLLGLGQLDQGLWQLVLGCL